jgi:hypothetical protein
MATETRTPSEIDAELSAVRSAKSQLVLAPASGDRARQRQTLEARERELVAEREVAAEEAAAAKLAALQSKIESLEDALDGARDAAAAAAREHAEVQVEMNAALAKLAGANQEVESRMRALEGVTRQIDDIQRMEASTPAAIRAAAEAALAQMKFAPEVSRFEMQQGRGPILKLSGYTIDPSVPRAAVDAIARYLGNASREDRRDFEDRFRALAEASIAEARAEATRQEFERQGELEAENIAARAAAAVERLRNELP